MDKALFISIALFLYLKYRAKEQFPSEEQIPYEWLETSPDDWYILLVGTLPFENSVMQYKIPIMKYGQENGIEAAVIAGMIGVESEGLADAYNPEYHKYGLMQVGLSEARFVGYTGKAQGLLNPDNNIKYAAKYLKYCINQRNNLARGISGYNMGNVEKATTPYNANYVNAVSANVPRFRYLLSQAFPGYGNVFPKVTWLKTDTMFA
jgi:soluble lytic murein transglycosylase-like protein